MRYFRRMIARRRLDVALVLVALAVALIVAIAGSDSGAAWLRWVLVALVAGVLVRTLTSGAAASAGQAVVAAEGALDDAVENELKRCKRTGRPMSVVLCEIDWFGDLDGKHGAGSAQKAGQQVGDLIRSSAREIDVVARVGDGQFGLLLPETHDSSAAVVAERLRTAIARWSPQGGTPLTASFGVAGWEDDGDVLADAWSALDEARSSGRDRVVVAGGDDLAS